MMEGVYPGKNKQSADHIALDQKLESIIREAMEELKEEMNDEEE